MNLTLIGINHKTAPIEVRELFYLTTLQQELLLSELKCDPLIVEGFVLSTCNRTEVYLHAIDDVNVEKIIRLISLIKNVEHNPVHDRNFYCLNNEEAIKHLFNVACGLDSLILGEKQILGQVKDAFKLAKRKGFFTATFHMLSNFALRAGKKARNETAIDSGGSSVSWAAVTQVEKELKGLMEKSMLIIGAGKMSALTVGQITNKGFKKLYLMNRTPGHAENLAKKFHAQVVLFADMKDILGEVDACICAASAPHFILEKETLKKIVDLRGGRKLVLIDISMPRNIDPQAADVKGITLFHIDELEAVVENNLLKRENAVKDVELLVAKKLKEFHAKLNKNKERSIAGVYESIKT